MPSVLHLKTHTQPIIMLAKPKSQVFLNTVVLELDQHHRPISLHATLKDEKGSVMGRFFTEIEEDQTNVNWDGLDNLPYGVYSLELTDGEREARIRVVKRI